MVALGTALLLKTAGKSFDLGAKSIAALISDARSERVSIDTTRARECFIGQIGSLDAWSKSISLLSLLREKKLAESFVELSMDIGLLRGADPTASKQAITALSAYAAPGHFAILGRPGAGKTTTLQRMAQIAIADWEAGTGGVPILVRLRDLGPNDTLVTFLLAQLGINIRFPKSASPQLRRGWEQRVLLNFLDSIGAVVLVDGLDECDPSARRSVETELRDVALYPGAHRLILTCRTVDYRVKLQSVQEYTLRPLSSEQVREFASRWLGSEKAAAFLQAVSENPYAGTEVVPLTLAHLCAIYERDGELPPRPIDVYEQIVSLLIEQWDRERGIKRHSSYSDFSWRKKERFLQAIAYGLAMKGRRGSFSTWDLDAAYKDVAAAFSLPSDEASAVAEEVESHTGLIQESGYGRYEFVHLVIQEYLTAMHAHRASNPVRDLIPLFPNEMALVVAYSADPEQYLERVLEAALYHVDFGRSVEFLVPFFARVTIERPVWTDSARAGWVFIGFLDIISRHLLHVDQANRLHFPPDIESLLEDVNVARAIQNAIKESDIFEKDRSFDVIPRTRASLPPVMKEVMVTGSHGGITILRTDKNLNGIIRGAKKNWRALRTTSGAKAKKK